MTTLDDLRRRVAAAHHDLVRHGLVLFSWGNASLVDRALGLVLIKPSGADCQGLRPEQLVAVRLDDGAVVGGSGAAPSSDTPTHLALYRAWPELGGIVHTHSEYATSVAQAGLPITALGTTHADCFQGDIPCTRPLTAREIDAGYEASTGAVIIASVAAAGLGALAVPAALVSQHGPFAWGATVEQAVEHAAVLERLARMLVHTRSLNALAARLPQHLLDRHWNRKHGQAATYGQPGRGPPVKSFRRELWFETATRTAFINITPQVAGSLAESGVREGLVLVNAMHITASVFINDDERGLHQDFTRLLERLAPYQGQPPYQHNLTGEDNADAHLKRQLFGREVVLAVSAGALDLGPWEQVFYGEFDGLRRKRVLVKIIGE